jgi:peroxiredoxin
MATLRPYALFLALCLSSLAHPARSWAQEQQTPAEVAAAIKRDHAALEKSFYQELVAARRDRQKVSDANATYREVVKKHASVLQVLIKDHPADPAALDAAITLVGDVRYPLGDEIAQIVLDHHIASETMGQLCFHLRSRGDEPWAVRILETCVAKHPQRDVRGQATFALGDGYRWVARPFGEPPPDADKVLEKAKSYYQQVVDNFADVSTPDGKWNLGERAEHELSRIRNLPNLKVGRPAPPIVGTDLDGNSLKLEDYRGNVVVVVFWGSWCGPCMAQVPHERELHKRLQGKPFALLGVSCGDALDVAKETVKKHQMEWPSWWDSDETRSGPIQTDYDVQHWPTVFVIDAEGIIRAIDVHGAELDAAVDQALAKIGDSRATP